MTRSSPPPSAENWLSRAEYRRILRGQILPDSVIATKSTSKSDHWREGHKRDILHQCWLISTDDRDVKKDNAVFQIDFDRCVDVNGVRLSDDTRLNDNLTKKISCITLLVIGYGKHKLNAQSVRAICDYFDWMVRWRLSLYINCISDIMESDFHNFLELASVNDITSLVPLADRLDWLVSEVENGQFRLPLALTENKSLTLNWTALSEKLGVTRRGLAASLEFRSELIDRLYSLDSINSAYLAANLALPPPGCDVPRSVRSVRGLLETWYCVSIFSKMGLLNHDPLTFDPFKQRTMLSFAKENGHEGIRTLTLLPDDFLGVLNAAATWVLDFAPHILRVIQLSEEVSSRNLSSHYDKLARQRLAEEMDANAPAGMPMIWPSLRFAAMEAKTSRLDLRTVVRYLMTACAILIMGFGARRIGEVTSLRTGCLIEEKPHLCDLSVYIEKTLRDIDRIPVPILIKSVIAILESLTAASRSDTGKQWLFEIVRTTDSGKQVYLHLEFRKLLNLFPLVNGLATPNGWEQWVLKAHQLRRGFAISYYHGNLAASLDALSRFLRHFDPEVTRIYISESLPGLIGRLREEISARTKVGLTTLSDEDKRWLSNTKDLLADLEVLFGLQN